MYPHSPTNEINDTVENVLKIAFAMCKLPLIYSLKTRTHLVQVHSILSESLVWFVFLLFYLFKDIWAQQKVHLRPTFDQYK